MFLYYLETNTRVKVGPI